MKQSFSGFWCSTCSFSFDNIDDAATNRGVPWTERFRNLGVLSIAYRQREDKHRHRIGIVDRTLPALERKRNCRLTLCWVYFKEKKKRSARKWERICKNNKQTLIEFESKMRVKLQKELILFALCHGKARERERECRIQFFIVWSNKDNCKRSTNVFLHNHRNSKRFFCVLFVLLARRNSFDEQGRKPGTFDLLMKCFNHFSRFFSSSLNDR